MMKLLKIYIPTAAKYGFVELLTIQIGNTITHRIHKNLFQCICTFKFEGTTCSKPKDIQTAAFGGTSFLSHRISDSALHGPTPTIDVKVQARTLAPDGVLLHATVGDDAYMTVYLKAGLLKFEFSCGVQTMLLGETRAPVNDGNEMSIRARYVHFVTSYHYFFLEIDI